MLFCGVLTENIVSISTFAYSFLKEKRLINELIKTVNCYLYPQATLR